MGSSVALTDRDSPGGNVIGFNVYLATGKGGAFSKAYSVHSASVTSFSITGIIPGMLYQFKVSAFNLSGEGTLSDILLVYACDDPEGIFAPTYVSATETTMTVEWKPPMYDGRCPISSYALFIDDGLTGIPSTEVNTANDSSIRNIPTLRQATITLLTSLDLGKDYSLKLQVSTARGDYFSEIVKIKFATVPPSLSLPTPVEDSAKTSSTQVTVIYSASDTGGSPVLGYNLQYGVGLGGGFSDLIPASYNNMATSYTLTNVQVGQTYFFRFRAKNMYGWSDFSSTGYIIASEVPAQANSPIISSASSTSIVLTFDQSTNSMGSSISSYILYWTSGSSPSAFTQLSSYDGTSTSFTLPSGTDTITAGQYYYFKYAAKNLRGTGEVSSSVTISATSLLPAPTGLAKVQSLSTQTSIYLSWDASTPVNLPGDTILGYRLYVFDQESTQYTKIYDGQVSLTPSQTTYSFNNAVLGNEYTFYVTVVTYNGESDPSTIFSTYACVAPSGFAAPTIDSVTLSSISISWIPPTFDGGCPISGYAVFLDSGSGYNEVNSANDVNVRNKPELRSFIITSLGSATTGSTVKIKIAAYAFDSVFSSVKSVLIAIVPNAPTTSVTRVDDGSKDSSITISFNTISTSDMNGAQVLSYSLEIRKGANGDFTIYSGANGISSMKTSFILTSPWVSKGNTYAFRYRALNVYGFGDYSPVSYITVSNAPDKPNKLSVSSYSSSSITLSIPINLGDGGSPLTTLQVYYADGLTSSTYTAVSGWTYGSTTWTIGVSNGLTVGHIFKFKHNVANVYFTSDYSDEIYVGLVDQSIAVTGLSRVTTLSSKTSITLTWDLMADGSTPAGAIRGYRLYMIDPSISEDAKLVYDGNGYSQLNYYTVSGLTTGSTYKFTVVSLDFNGEGVSSNELSLIACTPPIFSFLSQHLFLLQALR